MSRRVSACKRGSHHMHLFYANETSIKVIALLFMSCGLWGRKTHLASLVSLGGSNRVCLWLTQKQKTTRSKYECTKRYYTNKSIHTLAGVQLYEGGSTKKGLNDRCSMKSESWHAPTGWSISACPIFEPQSLRVLKIIQFLGKRARGKGVQSLGEPFKAFAGKWKLQRLTLSARILRGNCQSCTRSTCRSCRLSRRRRPRTWSAVPKTWFLTQKTQQIRRLPTQNVEQATMFSLRP